jgi:hypothetical protein
LDSSLNKKALFIEKAHMKNNPEGPQLQVLIYGLGFAVDIDSGTFFDNLTKERIQAFGYACGMI